MKKIYKYQYIAIAALLITTGCSLLPDWLGPNKKNSGIKGERISVLGIDSKATVSNELDDIKVLIPRPSPNEKWYKSNGRDLNTPSNIELTHNLIHKKEVGIGGGGKDGQHISAAPVVAEGKVFVINAFGKVSAFNAKNINKREWFTTLRIGNKRNKGEGYARSAGITYHDGNLYITSGYSDVFALKASTGEIIWSRTLSSIARSAPDAKDNTIFINSIDNRLYALDAKNGNILWTHTGGATEISMYGSASPVAYEDFVIIPYSSGEMYTINAKDGREIWADVFARRSLGLADTISDIDASPAVSYGKVFVISNDGTLSALDIKTGKRLWNLDISGRQTPWIAGNFLYVISNNNELICVHIPTGGIKWVAQLKKYKKNNKPDSDMVRWSGPVMAGDYLWAVASNGKLIGFSPRDGRVEYETSVSKNIFLPPVVAYGNLYLYSDNAELFAYSDQNNK